MSVLNAHSKYAAVLAAAAVVAAATAPAQAAVLAEYRFAGGSPASIDGNPQTNAGAFMFTNTTDEAPVGGPTGNADIGFSSGQGNAFIRSEATGSTQAAALADDDFFTFTVSPSDSSDVLDLDTLTLTAALQVDGSSDPLKNTTMATVYLTSSLDGFADEIDSDTVAAGALESFSFDLSGTQFNALSSITFKLSASDDGNDNADILRLDDVVLNGTVIPEPASLALLGLGGLMLLPRRRRVAA